MLRNVLVASTLALCASAPAWAGADTFELDTTHTYPGFTVNHLGFSELHGTFNATSGSLTYDQEKRTGSIAVTVDTASVSTGFAKRDEHLRSKDFFNAEKFPTMTFKADGFQLDADKAVAVNGSLTLLGVTKPLTLQVKPTKCAQRMDKNFVCGALVSGALKRSDWGMNTYVPFIGDDVQLAIEVEAVKK